MIVIVCSVLITKGDAILLIKEKSVNKYGLPGGKLEQGESLRDCAIREAREEIGAEIDIEKLVMVTEKPTTHEGNTVIRFIYTARIVHQAQTPELPYDYYSPQEIARFTKQGEIRGKDVIALFDLFYQDALPTLVEPLVFD